MEVRKLNSEDYDSILVKWWKDWRWTAPPKDFLPNNGEGGFIVYDKGTPVCAGYMYVTNSKFDRDWETIFWRSRPSPILPPLY